MKKLILAVAIGCFGFGAQAQDVNFGLTGGINFANMIGDYNDNDTKVGGNFGVLAEFEVMERMSIQPEAKYSMQGFKNGDAIAKDLDLHYINIPIKVKFELTDNFDLFAGPQIGFNTKAEVEANGKTIDISEETTRTDFGVVFGGEYVSCEGFGAGLGYNYGLSNTIDESPFLNYKEANNSVFNLNLIYKFGY